VTTEHYTGDVLMAVITSRLIEYELPLKKKTTKPEEYDEHDQRANERISQLIDESMEVNSHHRIVATDSDREEDLECYKKQRFVLNNRVSRKDSMKHKTT
jgi:hypothetical protein